MCEMPVIVTGNEQDTEFGSTCRFCGASFHSDCAVMCWSTNGPYNWRNEVRAKECNKRGGLCCPNCTDMTECSLIDYDNGDGCIKTACQGHYMEDDWDEVGCCVSKCHYVVEQ